MPREILVFISSPGDCAAERSAARRIIEELNAGEDVASQGLRLRPLLWEDLPPGIAESGDFQKCIDSLIKRGGYSGYGIYVGIMKRKLGTPTPRYASGTVEEFEESLKRRRRTGMPVEILFYFVDDGTPPTPDVEEFKRHAEKRGLLHAEVPADRFAERLGQNLFDIAKSWSGWRAVIRRLWRPLRNVAGALAIIAVLALIAFDLAARHRIDSALMDTDTLPSSWRGTHDGASATCSRPAERRMPPSRVTAGHTGTIRRSRRFSRPT